MTGIILAAGRSSRFGTIPKQLLEFGGEPLLRRVAREACRSGLSDVVVVIGHRSEDVSKAVRGLDVRLVRNRNYREGISSSIQTGLDCLSADTPGAMFLPGDQPFLSRAVIDLLLQRFQERTAPILVPVFGKRAGSPVIFDRSMFQELSGLRGDRGGRVLIRRFPHRVERIALEDDLPLLDIDTMEDYRSLSERLQAHTRTEE